jgi:Holliday junction resolvasome RuvABC endonuclease subunit
MAANRILFGLLAIVDMFCQAYLVEKFEYRPKAIKKFWTGNGNADKKLMVKKAYERGFGITNHNEVDAVAQLIMHVERTKC